MPVIVVVRSARHRQFAKWMTTSMSSATISNRTPESKKPFAMDFFLVSLTQCALSQFALFTANVCRGRSLMIDRSFVRDENKKTNKICWKKCVMRQTEQQNKFFNFENHTKKKTKVSGVHGRELRIRSGGNSQSIRHVINHFSLDAKHRWISSLMTSRHLKHMHTVASARTHRNQFTATAERDERYE